MKIKVSLLIFFCFFFNTSLNAEEKTRYIDVDKIISESEPGSNLLNQLSIIEKKFLTNFKLEDEEFLVEKNNILSSKNIITKEEYEKKILSYQDKLDVLLNFFHLHYPQYNHKDDQCAPRHTLI